MPLYGSKCSETSFVRYSNMSFDAIFLIFCCFLACLMYGNQGNTVIVFSHFSTDGFEFPLIPIFPKMPFFFDLPLSRSAKFGIILPGLVCKNATWPGMVPGSHYQVQYQEQNPGTRYA